MSAFAQPGGLPTVLQLLREMQDQGLQPDRFASPDTREAQRCAYMPFSMGARVCVGASFALQEAALVLAEIVRRFEVSPVPGHEPEPVSRLTVRSENGIRLFVRLAG